MFDPKTTKYPYTEFTDGHYIHVKKKTDIQFDKDYPFIDNSKWYKFKRFWLRIFLRLIVLPVSNTRLGIKVKGRKNLKKHKEVLKKGVISVCNHVHYWDYLGILHGIRYHKPKFLAWAENINGGLGGIMRLVGGIPIPEKDIRAQINFSKSIVSKSFSTLTPILPILGCLISFVLKLSVTITSNFCIYSLMSFTKKLYILSSFGSMKHSFGA